MLGRLARLVAGARNLLGGGGDLVPARRHLDRRVVGRMNLLGLLRRAASDAVDRLSQLGDGSVRLLGAAARVLGAGSDVLDRRGDLLNRRPRLMGSSAQLRGVVGETVGRRADLADQL